MASMVAKACTGSSNHIQSKTFQQKKSRNKRKSRVDPPFSDPRNSRGPSSSKDRTPFKFTAENFDSHDEYVNGCDMCDACQVITSALELNLGLSCSGGTSEIDDIDTSTEELDDTDWSGIAEFQLEELVLSNLDAIFRSAIKKLVASGYDEELASKAVLRSGLWYGCEDMVTNIVENTLALLKSGQDIDTTKGYYFDDLQEMERFVLAELICLLREVRPFLSNGDSLWCLLMSDMNLSHACVTDANPAPASFLNPDINSSVSAQNCQLKNELKGLGPDTSVQCKTDAASMNPSCSGQKMRSDKSKDAVGMFIKNGSVKATQGLNMPPSNKSHALTTSTRLSSKPTFDSETTDDGYSFPKSNASSILPQILMNKSFSLPFSETELSLSIPAKNTANPVPISCSIEVNPVTYPGSLNDESAEQRVSRDQKDQMIMNLNSRVKELQNLLQEWSEWANQKVMQVARRLSKDRAELKALKQEKEDVERLKRQRQKLEEGTLRKLAEMENALRKASGQIERGNAAVQRLELVNTSLRHEMEAAKLHAIESSANWKELLKREKKTVMEIQSCEKQKTDLQNELSVQKSKVVQLNQKLKQAKDCKYQIEARLNQEEMAMTELISQVTSIRKEREQIEASAKSKEDTLKSKAESNLRQHKDDINKLQKDISQLRLKTGSSKMAALKRYGVDSSYANKFNISTDSSSG